jgi:subtilisin family serine protease
VAATIDVNHASPWQLAVLLDVSRETVEHLLQARPFSDVEALRTVLREELRAPVDSLSLQKLDVNAADEATLIAATGVTSRTAASIVQARPFHFMRQLRTLVGGETYDQVEALFTTQDLEFADKLTGQTITLTPDSGQVLLSRSESESFSGVTKELGLQRLYPGTDASLYEVLAIPETEGATDVLSHLQASYGRNVLPAYRDQRSVRRYFNPRFCTVQFNPDSTATLAEEAIARLGLEIEESHRTPGLYTLRIPDTANPTALTDAIGTLNSLPEVKFAEPNYLGFDDREAIGTAASASAGENDTSGISWNLELTRVSQAWRSTRGSESVTIAVVDSGADQEHPGLHGALVHQEEGDDWNFVDDGPRPVDDDGHGTFIAGLLVGNGWHGIHGICPDCRVLPLKIPLAGEVNSYVRRRDAILYALERVGDGPLIMNLSWKTTGDVGLIRDAIATAAARGALVVASAGNSPAAENEPHYPSDYPSVISVAAVGRTRQRAPYSYWGDEVDMSAPGGDRNDPSGRLLSTEPGGRAGTQAGTSFAAPHIAGIAALVFAARPSLHATGIRWAIESSASPLAERGLGRGLGNAAAAVVSAGGGPAAVTSSVGVVPASAPAPPASAPSRARGPARSSGALWALNTADAATLVAQFGMLPFTARVIVARRPYTNVSQVRSVLGLSDAQYQRLTAL